MIQCVVTDDEPLAREGLAGYVKEIGFLSLLATCENPVELTNLLGTQHVDLVFLDIQMPKMSGIDFLKTIQNPPMTIVTTAYPAYALEGYQLNVLDYLLKPITFDRFLKACNKAKDYFDLTAKATQTESTAEGYFFIKCSNKFEKILFSDVLYVEAMQNYVIIYTQKGKYITLLLLKDLEQNLHGKNFIRVHKSFIVSINKIDRIENNEIFIESFRVPISRSYKEQFIEQVVSHKLWAKSK